MDVYYKRIGEKCRLCGQKTFQIINLPSLPLTDILFPEPTEAGTIDQDLCLCEKCGHAQMSAVASPEILYGKNYSYRTSHGKGSKKVVLQFLDFIDSVSDGKKFKNIIEIGCNDCYLLNLLKHRGQNLIGIDPILKDHEKEYSNITIIGDFIENVQLKQYPESLIISSHMIEHIENPRQMLEKLLDNSDDDSLFVFQFPGFETLIRDHRFDLVYSHHLHYFSLFSFANLLSELNCEIVKWQRSSDWFGTLMVAFKKETGLQNHSAWVRPKPEDILESYQRFNREMEYVNECIESFENEEKIAYGAGLQLPVLSYHLRNNLSSFECILDDDSNKDGLFFPNFSIPIKHPGINLKEAVVLITAPNFSRNILTRLIPLNPKRIILPFNVLT